MRRNFAAALVVASITVLGACGSSAGTYTLKVWTGVENPGGSIEDQMNAAKQCGRTDATLRGILEVRDGDHHLLVAKDLKSISVMGKGNTPICAQATIKLPDAKLYRFSIEGDGGWTLTPARLKHSKWTVTLVN